MKFLIIISLCLLISATGCRWTTSTVSVNKSNTNEPKLTAASGPLLGKWKDRGADLIMDFKADGMYDNTYEGRKTFVRYEYVNASRIKTIDSKSKVSFGKFTVNGNQMTLTWTDSSGDAATQYFDKVY